MQDRTQYKHCLTVKGVSTSCFYFISFTSSELRSGLNLGSEESKQDFLVNMIMKSAWADSAA